MTHKVNEKKEMQIPLMESQAVICPCSYSALKKNKTKHQFLKMPLDFPAASE